MIRNISNILRIVIVIIKAIVNNGNATIWPTFLVATKVTVKDTNGLSFICKKCSPYVEISE